MPLNKRACKGGSGTESIPPFGKGEKEVYETPSNNWEIISSATPLGARSSNQMFLAYIDW